MNVLRSILIKAMINLPDKDLRKMFITVSNLCHGLTDRDAMTPKEQMSYEAAGVVARMNYEDVEFFCNFVYSYAQKKGIEVTIDGKEKASA